jgi:hypothetical protein
MGTFPNESGRLNGVKKDLPTITDDYMRQMCPSSKVYCGVILKAGPRFDEPGADNIIWKHGRPNDAPAIAFQTPVSQVNPHRWDGKC